MSDYKTKLEQLKDSYFDTYLLSHNQNITLPFRSPQDIDERIEYANEILEQCEEQSEYEFELLIWGDSIIAFPVDEQKCMYGIKVMSLNSKKNMNRPYVIDTEIGFSYEYSQISESYEVEMYADLLIWVLSRTVSDYIRSDADVKICLTYDSYISRYIPQPSKEFKNLVNSVFSSDNKSTEDKRLKLYERDEKGRKVFYIKDEEKNEEEVKEKILYECDRNKVVDKVNPYCILNSSSRTDYKFERDLRAIVIKLAGQGHKESDLKDILFVNENEKDNEKREANQNYNNWLKNECVSFNEDEYKGIEKVSKPDKEKETKELFIGVKKKEITDEERKILNTVIDIFDGPQYTMTQAFIDNRGVIKYVARRKTGGEIVGCVGQVFLPEESGGKLIKTRFLVDKTNYWFVPGYRALIQKRNGQEDKRSLEERTILTGYIQMVSKYLRKQIRRDILLCEADEDGEYETIENTTGLNWIYKTLYEERFDYDFLAKKCEKTDCALPYSIREAIVNTLANKVRYSNHWHQSQCFGVKGLVYSLNQDKEEGNYFNYFNKEENIFLIDGEKGYFDPDATASGEDQGSARYLVEGAIVNPDGTIKPSNDENDRAPIFKHEFLKKYTAYNPFDRNQMVFSNLMRAYRITDDEETVLMTCGGWNMEDGFVISKAFAEKYKVPISCEEDDDDESQSVLPENEKAKLRPLMVGDKMLDRGGNKGVISIIVDPNGKDKKTEKLRKIFKDNPGLAVIASPYSGLSRYNGATARELMEGAQDLKDGDKKVIGKCIGKAQYIITRQFADKKTRIYDEEDYKEGASRKASPQLAWALCSKDAKEMLKYFYKTSSKSKRATEDVVLLLCAYFNITDIVYKDDGHIEEDGKEDKRIYQLIKKCITNETNELEIEEILSHKGGAKIDQIGKMGEENPRFFVLPARLRKGYIDYAGRKVDSEITKIYRNILSNTDEDSRKRDIYKLKRILKKLLFGNDNIIKSIMMTRDVEYSTTAIWTPDPTLSIDSIAISKTIADRLKVEEKRYLLIWRDPILRDANVRYMKIERIDPSLIGIAINPVMAKGFDGDFDGDTVAVVKLPENSDAHKEAMKKFSVANNLLDEGKPGSPHFINTGLDLVSTGKEKDEEFKHKEELKEGIEKELEKVHKDLVDGEIDNQAAVERINEILQMVFSEDYYLKNAMICLDDKDTVIESLETIIDSGAKKGNIETYEKYFNGKATPEERRNVQMATAIKSAVGVAGRFSQQLMRVCRDICPKSVLEITYPNTQALLQIKHDPDRAVEVYKRLDKDLMDAWNTKREEDRYEEIKKIYEELEQPINEDFLSKVDEALSDDGLTASEGAPIDELAYPKGVLSSEELDKQIEKLISSIYEDTKDMDKYSNSFYADRKKLSVVFQ